jgi:ABC-type nitrate/sulfonate/bicarbonate transport system permease component
VQAYEASLGRRRRFVLLARVLVGLLFLGLWHVSSGWLIDPLFVSSPIAVFSRLGRWVVDGTRFGIGIESKVAVSASIVVFVIFLNTYAGVRDVNPIYVHSTRIMGGNEVDVLRYVVVPSAAAWVITGLKVSVPYALVGTVIGEFMSSNRGIGFLIRQASGLFDTTSVFAGLITLAVVGALINQALRHLETGLLRWRRELTERIRHCRAALVPVLGCQQLAGWTEELVTQSVIGDPGGRKPARQCTKEGARTA